MIQSKMKISILSKKFYSLFLFILLISCSSIDPDIEVKQITVEYYKTYQASNDFVKFLDFYAAEIELQDIINGDKIQGKEKLKDFFNWNHPELIRNDSLTLIIKDQIFRDKKVITTGYFTPFKWGELEVEAMHFTTILYFNKSHKIIKQIDWINYPSSLIANRKNSNNWILK
jgi:hypothetical protein